MGQQLRFETTDLPGVGFVAYTVVDETRADGQVWLSFIRDAQDAAGRPLADLDALRAHVGIT